jgi:predicted nucleotidyltransferase
MSISSSPARRLGDSTAGGQCYDAGMSLQERLAVVARAFPSIELLVLFGSTARGTRTAGSDVDLGVRFRDPSPALCQQVEAALGRAAGQEIDLVDLASASPLLRFQIARDGRLIHEGHPRAWTDFRARAMIDWWDWAPTARMIHRAAIRRLRDIVEHGPA